MVSHELGSVPLKKFPTVSSPSSSSFAMFSVRIFERYLNQFGPIHSVESILIQRSELLEFSLCFTWPANWLVMVSISSPFPPYMYIFPRRTF